MSTLNTCRSHDKCLPIQRQQEKQLAAAAPGAAGISHTNGHEARSLVYTKHTCKASPCSNCCWEKHAQPARVYNGTVRFRAFAWLSLLREQHMAISHSPYRHLAALQLSDQHSLLHPPVTPVAPTSPMALTMQVRFQQPLLDAAAVQVVWVLVAQPCHCCTMRHLSARTSVGPCYEQSAIAAS